jgi:hypothetical protein
MRAAGADRARPAKGILWSWFFALQGNDIGMTGKPEFLLKQQKQSASLLITVELVLNSES